MATEQFDVCIVGSGASGSVMAKELCEAGLKVALIEKGDWARNKIGFENFRQDGDRRWLAEDELYFKHWMPFLPRPHEDPTLFSEAADAAESESRVGYSYELVGGGTRLYAGAAWRYRERDFKKRSYYGQEEGASLVDWPISYSDLEPFYTKAERELGISGHAGDPSAGGTIAGVPCGDETEPWRSADHLLAPLKLDAYSKKVVSGARALGLNPSYMPMALVSKRGGETSGFGHCRRSGWCSGLPCQFDGKSSADIRLLHRIVEEGKYHGKNGFRLFPNSVAFRVETDRHGRCTGVLCKRVTTFGDRYDPGPPWDAPELGEWFFVPAKIVVLAASAIQTTRLMLLSESSLFPDGLANESGLLGRNLMFHIYGKQMGIFEEEFPFTLNKLLAINDYQYPDKYFHSFSNHVSVMSGSKWGPIKFARNWDRNFWGEAYIRDVVDRYARTQLLQAAVEDLPQERNYVTLHPTRVDKYGMPVPKVVHRYHPRDREALRFALEMCARVLQASGATVDEVRPPHGNVNENYTYHLMGTCRMGSDERDSVVDRHCRSHSIPNLFVVDGSVFPTSSALNPTLTIQANAYRVAHHIVEQCAKGKDWHRRFERVPRSTIPQRLWNRRPPVSQPIAPVPAVPVPVQTLGMAVQELAERYEGTDFWAVLLAAADRIIPGGEFKLSRGRSSKRKVSVGKATELGIEAFLRRALEAPRDPRPLEPGPDGSAPFIGTEGYLRGEVPEFARFVKIVNRYALRDFDGHFQAIGKRQKDLCLHNARRRDPGLFARIRKRIVEGYFSDVRHKGNAEFQSWDDIELDSRVVKWRRRFLAPDAADAAD